MHTDDFSFDLIGLSNIFNIERDQRLNLPGYQDILYRTCDDGRGGGRVFSKKIYLSASDMIQVFLSHILWNQFVLRYSMRRETLYK